MIKLHECEIKVPEEIKREMIVMLERLKLDVQDGLIVGVQAACLRADGVGHQVTAGTHAPPMSEIHAQFIYENRKRQYTNVPFFKARKEGGV